MSDERGDIRELSERLVAIQQPIRILNAVAWDERVRAEFFAGGCASQPRVGPDYYRERPLGFDCDALRADLAELGNQIAHRLGRTHPASRILRRMVSEYRVVIDLLEARGTPGFSALSAELYGSSREALHAGQASLADLGRLLDDSLDSLDRSSFVDTEERTLSAEEAVARLQERLDRTLVADGLRVRVCVDDGIVADAAAGSDYIKLRADRRFSDEELAVLEAHEGWVHVGTTLNGRAQTVCSFLGKGTPATSVTQEGLAVLVEVTSLRSNPARLRRISDRIRAIHMAESGATFLDVFRTLTDEGRTREEAWSLAVRVFRGSAPECGPFTKDLSYARGFVELYNFIRLAVRRGRADRIPLLFVGKVLLGEIGLLAQLDEAGLLDPPRFLPPVFARPGGLMSWMAFSGFLNRLDLAAVEAEYADLLR